jgi:hypothetical protein
MNELERLGWIDGMELAECGLMGGYYGLAVDLVGFIAFTRRNYPT